GRASDAGSHAGAAAADAGARAPACDRRGGGRRRARQRGAHPALGGRMKRDPILTIRLPAESGVEEFAIHEPTPFRKPTRPFTRVAYGAAHVVADPRSAKEPWLEAAIDWDATIAYRRHLWSWGFGVAEAMDTAQRGMGLDWKNSLELVRRSI